MKLKALVGSLMISFLAMVTFAFAQLELTGGYGYDAVVNNVYMIVTIVIVLIIFHMFLYHALQDLFPDSHFMKAWSGLITMLAVVSIAIAIWGSFFTIPDSVMPWIGLPFWIAILFIGMSLLMELTLAGLKRALQHNPMLSEKMTMAALGGRAGRKLEKEEQKELSNAVRRLHLVDIIIAKFSKSPELAGFVEDYLERKGVGKSINQVLWDAKIESLRAEKEVKAEYAVFTKELETFEEKAIERAEEKIEKEEK